jgi:hypothetical protein
MTIIRTLVAVIVLGILVSAPAAAQSTLKECADRIDSKPIHATLDLRVTGESDLIHAWTPNATPSQLDGLGGDWWAYANPNAAPTDACDVAAYIKLIPRQDGKAQFYGLWSHNSQGQSDFVHQGWPAPDFCQHSTLKWAVYGRNFINFKWQLVSQDGQPMATEIFGTPATSG